LKTKGITCVSPQKVAVTEQDRTYLAKATTCKIGSELVAVASFESASQRGQYLAIGQAGTGAYPHFVLGTTWAVATLTKATADQIAKAVGGTVH
jgi:hypothetical protein